MEKITGDILSDSQYIIDMIEKTLKEVSSEFDIDLNEAGQQQFKFVLIETGERLFRDGVLKGSLKDKRIIKRSVDLLPTNSNKYNYDLLNILCDYYIKLSARYKKLVSITAFGYLFHIDYYTINLWGSYEINTDNSYIYNNPDNNTDIYSDPELYSEYLRYKALDIYKKLKGKRLDCILDKSFDSSNVMGAMYLGNSEYGLNMPGVRESKTAGRQLIQRETVQEIETAGNPLLPKVDES